MPLIASRDNAHFKMLRKLLASGRERRQSGQVILDGLHLLETYCAQQGVPDEVLLSESGAIRPEIAAWLQTAANGLRVSVFSDALFKQLSVVETPSGIMAVVRPPSPLPLAERADSVLLDGIQDPGNLGSLLRSAAAAGFRQVLLSNDCAQVWSPKTLRAFSSFAARKRRSADVSGDISRQGTGDGRGGGAQSLYRRTERAAGLGIRQ